uniref:Uncharacterized protein n=1 Tax=Aegilops tauschii TaxID=37682 RepID=M8B5C5_AEGTA
MGWDDILFPRPNTHREAGEDLQAGRFAALPVWKFDEDGREQSGLSDSDRSPPSAAVPLPPPDPQSNGAGPSAGGSAHPAPCARPARQVQVHARPGQDPAHHLHREPLHQVIIGCRRVDFRTNGTRPGHVD